MKRKIVRDRSVPVALNLPFREASVSDEEAQFVASGAMKLPERRMDWDSFFSRPKGNVSRETVVAVAISRR